MVRCEFDWNWNVQFAFGNSEKQSHTILYNIRTYMDHGRRRISIQDIHK